MENDNKAVVVVTGTENINKELLKSNVGENFDCVSLLVIGNETNTKKEDLKALFKCEDVIYASHASYPHIDGIYQTKKLLDKHKIQNCFMFLPFSIVKNFELICSLLIPAYQYKIIPTTKNGKSAKETTPEMVKKYLQCIPSESDLKIYKSSLIPEGFNHGYTSRKGGISTYPDQASLNMCYSVKKRDSSAIVMENRRRLSVAGSFKFENFHVASCVHGKDVWVYGKEKPSSYDAIITNTPGITIAAPGADCNIVLFCDPVTKSCGAAHAGWKGILAGIVESTVEKMVQNYGVNPKDLIVSVGPSLSVCCCEFGVDGAKPFSEIDENCVVWKEGCEKPFLDLRLAVQVLLERKGVKAENIEAGVNGSSNLKICTKCDPEHRFFSFRRVGPQFGNQVGFIGVQN